MRFALPLELLACKVLGEPKPNRAAVGAPDIGSNATGHPSSSKFTRSSDEDGSVALGVAGGSTADLSVHKAFMSFMISSVSTAIS